MIKRYTIIVLAIIMTNVTILMAPPPASPNETDLLLEIIQDDLKTIYNEKTEKYTTFKNIVKDNQIPITILAQQAIKYIKEKKLHTWKTNTLIAYLQTIYKQKLTQKKINGIINQSSHLLNLKKHVPTEQIIKTIKNYGEQNPNAKRKEIVEHTQKALLPQKIARLKEKEVNTKKLIQKYKEKIRKLQEERAIFHQKRKYAKKEYLKLKIKELNLKPLVIPTKKFFTTDGTVSYRKNILEDEEEIPFTPNSANSTISNLSAISTPKTPSIPIPHSNYSYHQHQKAAHPSSLSSRSSSETPRSTSPSLTNQSLNLNLKDIDPFAGYVLKQK